MNNSGKDGKWKKILYEDQGCPDNYTDPEKFLEGLAISTRHTSSMWPLFIGSTVIVQQVTVMTIFLACYKCIIKRYISVYGVVILDIVYLLIGLLINRCIGERKEIEVKRSAKSALMFGICLRIATPVLQILTSNFSNDTIYALTIVFSVIHLVFFDYQYVLGTSDNYSGKFSLNAAIFVAVVLASRIHRVETVFAFVLLGTISFSLFPKLAKIVHKHSFVLHALFVGAKWIFASLVLFWLDKALFTVYQFIIILLLVLGPYWLSKMYAFKKELRGPWDIM